VSWDPAPWRPYRAGDHHFPCPGGCNQLADECACEHPNPLGSIRVNPPIGSTTREDDTP